MKKIFILIISFSIIYMTSFQLKASYNYTEFGGVDSSEPMSVKKVLDANTLVDVNNKKIEIGEIVDMTVCEDLIYILDKAKNAFHILNEDYVVIDSYYRESSAGSDIFALHSPEGIAVIKDGKYHRIFIADTEYIHKDENNENIQFEVNGTKYDETGRIISFLRIAKGAYSTDFTTYTKPDDPSIKDIQFKPSKITVDSTKRVYCIAKNVFEGIIDFNPDTTFNRFFGANKVSSLGFWSIFFSSTQRKKIGVKLQTQFNNLVIDQKNFIYTVSKSSEAKRVQRINYKSNNTLVENGKVPVTGDISWQSLYDQIPKGPSEFVDIDVHPNGHYSVLDQNRSRIFTYDEEGNLLYVFGQRGQLQTSTQKPSAITYFGDDVLVSDTLNKNIVIYEPTEFGKNVNEAVYKQKLGFYEESKLIWEKILTQNSNYFLAYTGIGLSEYRSGNYKEAMINFEYGYDRINYSLAFKANRNQNMEKFYPFIMVLILLGVAGLIYFSVKTNAKEVKEGGDD